MFFVSRCLLFKQLADQVLEADMIEMMMVATLL